MSNSNSSENIYNFIDPKTIELYRKYKSSYLYFTERKDAINDNQSRDLFSGCSNAFGELSEDRKSSILGYINNPTEEVWDEIYCMIIDHSMSTLWQAWCLVDHQALRSKSYDGKWSKIPSGKTLIYGIRETIDISELKSLQEILSLKNKYEELESQYPSLKSSKLAQADYLKDIGVSETENITAKIIKFGG
jgi:hypothetical protein